MTGARAWAASTTTVRATRADLDRRARSRRGAAAPTSELQRAARLLASADSVVLLPHVRPDADALGSALALGLGLTSRGASVQVAFAEPAEVPHSLRHLPGQHLIVPAARVLDRPQLAVTVDVASAERLGSLRPLLSRAGTSLVVDHHATNTAFGRHHLVDASAEATVVLVERLLHLLDVPLDQDIATNLYAGLATDTVGFRHATAVTHQLAARLVAAGAHPARVLQPITDSHPFAWFAMLALTLADASLDREAAGGRGLAWVVVDSDASAGLRSEELDSVIDLLRTTAEAEVAAVLKQTGARLWQVSLRSRDLGPDAHGRDVSLDVARVAVALGGGGHRRAAGFTHVGDAASAVQALRRELAAQA